MDRSLVPARVSLVSLSTKSFIWEHNFRSQHLGVCRTCPTPRSSSTTSGVETPVFGSLLAKGLHVSVHPVPAEHVLQPQERRPVPAEGYTVQSRDGSLDAIDTTLFRCPCLDIGKDAALAGTPLWLLIPESTCGGFV